MKEEERRKKEDTVGWVEERNPTRVHLTFVNVYEIIMVSGAVLGISAKLRCTHWEEEGRSNKEEGARKKEQERRSKKEGARKKEVCLFNLISCTILQS
ncbi:hypothetical protein QUA56_15320 [Microcoleus sp. N3A4]|uniref:hypothetical protein n=1 Tax=Microcoleus sp. N3A4 TaxID=3055379 RepID=UPI002FD12EA5